MSFAKYIFSLLCLGPSLVFADTYVPGTRTTIIGIDSYNHAGGAGDARIIVKNTVAGCEAGYFILAEDPGVDRSLSLALSAFHTGGEVLIGGRSGIAWSGSSDSRYCKVHGVQLVK